MSSAAPGRPSSTLPQKVLEKMSEKTGSAALTWESGASGAATTESEDIMNTQHQQWSEEFEGTGVGTVRLSLTAVGSA